MSYFLFFSQKNRNILNISIVYNYILKNNSILKIIITSGDDNYIYLRKLYDFEFLLPIKIKRKYFNFFLYNIS